MTGIAGVHMMAFKREADVAGIIDRAGILADRQA